MSPVCWKKEVARREGHGKEELHILQKKEEAGGGGWGGGYLHSIINQSESFKVKKRSNVED